MRTVNLKKYFFNPYVGFLPYGLYILFFLLDIPILHNLGISVFVTFIGVMVSQHILKNIILFYTFSISLLTLLLVFVFWIIFNPYVDHTYTYVVIGNVIFIFQLMLISFTKVLSKSYLRQGKNKIEKALLNDYILTSSILRNVLTSYLLIISCYKQVTLSRLYYSLDNLLYYVVPVIIFFGIYFYQSWRIKSIQKKLNKEDWLPIMDERGEILGKVEKGVSFNMHNRYLHPVIRIVLIMDNQIFLQDRPINNIISPGKLDTPLESYVTCNNGANGTIQMLTSKIGDGFSNEPHFLTKYTYANSNTKRLIYLYALRIEREEVLNPSNGFVGKFWSLKRIEEQFDESIFSECFILEYEYIKNTAILEENNTVFKPTNEDGLPNIVIL